MANRKTKNAAPLPADVMETLVGSVVESYESLCVRIASLESAVLAISDSVLAKRGEDCHREEDMLRAKEEIERLRQENRELKEKIDEKMEEDRSIDRLLEQYTEEAEKKKKKEKRVLILETNLNSI
ncbi:MAG: uncharacterized protein A8A55_2390 [Amphiamblys sp. WSBS2006]|nr:MAG: uncharacterized protein A8A55_2390 [Amphiamblys sp. WSBS2006]